MVYRWVPFDINVLPGLTYKHQVEWCKLHGVSFRFRRGNAHRIRDVPGHPHVRDGRLTFVGPEAKCCHDQVLDEYKTLLPDRELKLLNLNIMNFVYRKGMFAERRPDAQVKEEKTEEETDQVKEEEAEDDEETKIEKKWTLPHDDADYDADSDQDFETKPEDPGNEEQEHVIYELHEKSESSSDSDDGFESVPVDDEAPAEGPAPPSILLLARPKLPPAQASQAAKASQAVPRRPAPAEPKAKPPAKVAGDGWSLPATKTEAADATGPKMLSPNRPF